MRPSNRRGTSTPLYVPNRTERRQLDRDAARARRAQDAEIRQKAAQVKARLQEILTTQLQVLTPKLMKSLAGWYPTVWDLSQAKRSDLLDIPDFGPKRLAQLQKYLEENKVELKWGLPRGD